MIRISHLSFIFIVLSAFFTSMVAQPALKIAIIESDSVDPYRPIREFALKALENNGYKAGTQFSLLYYCIGNDSKKAETAVSEAAEKKPDLVLLIGTIVAGAAKKLFFNDAKLKFIYAGVTDAVGVGLVSAIEGTPDANFTGVSFPVPVKARLRFVKNLFPSVKSIGLIYADMPQSISYKKWLDEALKDPEFKDISIIYRSVPLITGDGGAVKMIASAQPVIKELESQVDLFLSPNDQMGVNPAFATMVAATTKKPLIGMGKNDCLQGNGSCAVIYPSFQSIGLQTGAMASKILKGTPVKQIPSEWVKETGIAINLKLCQNAGVMPPMSLIKLAGSDIVK